MCMVTNLLSLKHPEKKSVTCQFSKTYGITSYGRGWRTGAVTSYGRGWRADAVTSYDRLWQGLEDGVQ